MIRAREAGGEKNNKLSVKNSPDMANTEMTAAVNKSHNKRNSSLLPGMSVDG